MNFLCGNNSWIIILIILIFFCNNDCGFSSCGCNNNSNSSCGCNSGCGYCG